MIETQECWFDAPDAFERIEAALRAGDIDAVTAHRLWDYVGHGYFIADGLIPGERIEHLRHDLDNLWFAEAPVAGLKIDGLTLSADEEPFSETHEQILARPLDQRVRLRDSGRWRIHGLHRALPSCVELCRSPKLWTAAQTLLELDDICVNSTNTFVYASQQSPHEDYPYLQCRPSYHMASVWVALEDVAEGQGALFVCPGSHREPKHAAFSEHPSSWYWTVPAYSQGHWLMTSQQRASRYPVLEFRAREGQCLFYHANLTHGGRAVTQPGATRKSIVIFYTSATAL